MSANYILNETNNPVECPNLAQWAVWMEDFSNRVVKKTDFGKVEVSTVFLGLDHSFGGGTPMLFETMIFGGEHNDYCERYATWDAAIEGHARAVQLVEGKDD